MLAWTTPWRPSPLEVLASALPRPGTRADRAMRDEVAELTGHGGSGNAFKTTDITTALKLGIAKQKPWADHAAQERYLAAHRRTSGFCLSLGVVPDESHFTVQDWLGNSLFSPNVD